ncbi:MAG: DUF420 domain-containing protein [Bacteroidetes bacterium]|nr:DUF420 domain-containing protein [Bacteroidota bacterium]
MLGATIKRNDQLAYWLIGIVSVIVFAAVVLLKNNPFSVTLGFDAHIFAKMNAVINSLVSVLLVTGYVLVMKKKYEAHRAAMLGAILLSVLFLVSYIAHHLFAGETKFGGIGAIRYFYFFILITHIVLAGIILPFILYTAYQSLSGQFAKHKKIARITFPIWLYVSITGVLVYLMISPYYQLA